MREYLFLKCITVSFTLGLFFLCPHTEAEAPDFTDNTGKIVSQGANYKIRLVEDQGEGVKTAEAVFLIKAKPEAVFRAVTDFDHYPEFMPNITKATCVDCSSNDKKYRFTLKVSLWDINYTLLLKSGYKDNIYSLTWEYVEGDIKDTSGSWRIGTYDKDKRYSLVFYRVKTDPGRFVPDWVADRLSTKSIPDMIEAVSKRSGENK
jgi:coenzyme Q-binding protein COQ10